jgi:hypothetical protein
MLNNAYIFAVGVDPSTYVIVCCVIALVWAFIQFMIIAQTR